MDKIRLSVFLIYLDLLFKVRFDNGSSLFSLMIFLSIILLFNNKIKFRLKALPIIFISLLLAFASIIIYSATNGDFNDFLNVEEYLFYTPIFFFISKIEDGKIFRSLMYYTYKYSYIILLLSVYIFYSRGYSFTLLPNFETRFLTDVKGNLFGPVILLGFVPVSLFYAIVYNRNKVSFNYETLFSILGIIFIFYFGYYTLTRSLALVIIYFFSFGILYGRWYNKILLLSFLVIASFFYVNQVQEYRNNDDFTSGRSSELDDLKNYLDKNPVYYYVPSLYGFTIKSENSDFIGSKKMMHNGFYHLVLQFGYIIAIFIYMYLMYLLIKSYLVKLKFEFIVLLNFILVSFIGTQWFSVVDMIILFAVINSISKKNLYFSNSRLTI
jgi:hypothetical protein